MTNTEKQKVELTDTCTLADCFVNVRDRKRQARVNSYAYKTTLQVIRRWVGWWWRRKCGWWTGGGAEGGGREECVWSRVLWEWVGSHFFPNAPWSNTTLPPPSSKKKKNSNVDVYADNDIDKNTPNPLQPDGLWNNIDITVAKKAKKQIVIFAAVFLQGSLMDQKIP